MQIFVQMNDGKTITLDVLSSDLIEDVKNKLSDQVRFPPDQQRLTFNGQELEDGRTLPDYGVEGGSTVNLEYLANG